jgi:LysM repeat protein
VNELAKHNVQITDVEYVSKNNYKITTQFTNNTVTFQTGAWIVGTSQIGIYLREAISTLGIDKGGAWIGSSTTITGTMTTSDTKKTSGGGTLITNIEVDTTSLKTIRSYNSSKSSSTKLNSSYTYVYDYLPNFGSKDSYVKGQCTYVNDGDTLIIKVSEVKNIIKSKQEVVSYTVQQGDTLSSIASKYNTSEAYILAHNNMEPADIVYGANIEIPLDPVVKVGDELTIRLVGVNCPEIKKTKGDWYSRNVDWAAKHGLEEPNDDNKVMNKITAIADEGKKFTQTFLGKTLVVDPEKGEYWDTYGRLIGCIYMPVSIEGVSYNAVCINTSLVANKSKTSPEFALAEPTYEWSYDSDTGLYTSKFPIFSWWKYAPSGEEKIAKLERKKNNKNWSNGKQKFLDKYGLKELSSSTLDNKTEIVYNKEQKVKSGFFSYIVQTSDSLSLIASKFGSTESDILAANNIKESDITYGRVILVPTYTTASDTEDGLWEENIKLNNTNDVPADSKDESYENMIVDDRSRLDAAMGLDPYNSFHLRIGDCSFLVPPLSIRFDTINSNQRVQALRSKSSIQTNTGHTYTIITVDLYFPNIASINGYEYKSPIGGAPYYRNGLRPLIAQFKRAPFLPIENELINERYGIYSVALKDIEISNVQGFPECIQARLTMYEFDHTVYMPSEEDFASTFCWPLFRWYYQRSLRENSDYPNRTYLKPVSRNDNSILFKIPDEKALKARQKAIYELDDKLAPTIFSEVNKEEGSTLNEMEKEANRIVTAKAQYQNFLTSIKKFPVAKYPKLYNKKGIFDSSVVGEMTKDQLNSTESTHISYSEAIRTILNDTYNSGADVMTDKCEILVYFVINNMFDLLRALDRSQGLLFSLPVGEGVDFYKSTWGTEVSRSSKNAVLEPHDKSITFNCGGSYVIEMKSSNASKISTNRKTGDMCIIDPGDYALIKFLTDTLETNSLITLDYEQEFEKLNFAAHMSERDIPEVSFPINNIYVQSMTAKMSNTYAPLQLSSVESPTFQHLGSSDTTLELTMRTKDREAISRFRQLMSTANRMSRDYRIAITSGVVSIETPLMNLLGTKSILIERLSVETSREDKESFNISISLVAFDKTQRSPEDLRMTTAFGGTESELSNAFYEYSKLRRNSSGFEYALVDFTLRDLEVYPDLDLPTFEELNDEIGLLGITYPDGITKFKHYPNPDNAKFVDPDFYIRCEHTFRDYLLAVLDEGDIATFLKDRLDFEALEYAPTVTQQKYGGMSKPNVEFSEDTTNWINKNLSSVYTGESKSSTGETGWGSLSSTATEKYFYQSKTTSDTKTLFNNPLAVLHGPNHGRVDAAIKAQITKANLSIKPTPAEVVAWGHARTQTAAKKVIAELRNPTEAEFVDYLTYLVKYVSFPNTESEEEEIKSGITNNLYTYKYGETRISAPKITQEKIINFLKALFEHESGWKQLDKKGNIRWSRTNDVGIGQLNAYTSGILRTLDQARHAAWFWKYNLELAVDTFARCYNFAIQGGKYNSDAPMNPLDWAPVAYNMGAITGLKKCKQPQDCPYYNSIVKIFKGKYGADIMFSSSTPGSSNDGKTKATESVAKVKTLQSQWYQSADGTMATSGVTNYQKDAYSYINLDTTNETGKYTSILAIDQYEEVAKSRKATSAVAVTNDYGLEGGSSVAISRLEKYIGNVVVPMIMKSKTFSLSENYVLIKKGASDVIEGLWNKGVDVYKKIDEKTLKQSTIFEIREVSKNAEEDIKVVETAATVTTVVAPDDVAILYRTAFSDALEYDHRGRMLRAFPTFQMFIIDEGRWMAWHKIWDNFYGFNSLISIDLCKDRRIAADTAVISMTNVYSNLTTHDNEVSYGEWDFTLGDLLWGSQYEKGKVWKTIWDLPDEDVLQARRDELNYMMLAPGARIHLRLGYGSNAYRLPVAFNGTVTEMNTEDILTIVAQGDGKELTNKLRVSPGDKNVTGIFGSVVEPRDYMCQMLTSKGGFLANLVNTVSGGYFYNKNPLGIAHFGVTEMPTGNLLKGYDWYNAYENYGECGQNIYCSAGINTMSQWIYTEGEKAGEDIVADWGWSQLTNGGQNGDEPNIKINLFDQTPWSVFQTFAHAFPDYITTVIPFEFRSTIFYGKPWWGVVDRYKYKYFYDNKHDMFLRDPYQVTKKALSQIHIYSSYFDIIGNGIKATEEFMYTNVMGIYDDGKKVTEVVQADSDIVTEKQTTATVNLPIKADVWWKNTWTQAKYAQAAATSTLRDYMKDMYQGELTVMGDPTVKPYDRIYINDAYADINGLAEVKRVVHHFSMETGFVSNITPDCISIIDDTQGISLDTWIHSACAGLVAFQTGLLLTKTMWKKLWTGPAAASFRKLGSKAINALLTKTIGKTSGLGANDLKRLESMSDEIVSWFKGTLQGNKSVIKEGFSWNKELKELDTILKKNGTYGRVSDDAISSIKKVFTNVFDAVQKPGGVGNAVDDLWDKAKILKNGELFTEASSLWTKSANKVFKAGSGLTKFGLKVGGNASASAVRTTSAFVAKAGVAGAKLLGGVLLDIAFTVITAALVEKFSRWLDARQALTVIPLRYRGDNLIAGLKGHKGVVAGDSPSAWDKFLSGTGTASGAVNIIYGVLGVEAPDYSKSTSAAAESYLNQE